MTKYRGMRKDNNEWVYGNRLELDNKVFIIPFDVELTEMIAYTGSDEIKWGLQIVLIEVIPETVGQYIGEKDKDKTELYHGDIFVIDNTNYDTEAGFYAGKAVVVAEICGYKLKPIPELSGVDKLMYDSSMFWSFCMEDTTTKIGTIHDERIKP